MRVRLLVLAMLCLGGSPRASAEGEEIVSDTFPPKTDTVAPAPSGYVIARQNYGRIAPPANKKVPNLSWQLTASASHSVLWNSYWPEHRLYERNDRPTSTRLVLDNGEFIQVKPGNQYYNTRNPGSSTLYRLGLAKPTKWGGLWNFKGGYYRGNSPADEAFLTGARPDEVRAAQSIRERIVTLETGLEFTFLRRHRFRPYLGVNLLTFLYVNGEALTRFYDERTGLSGLVEGFRYRQNLPLYPELSLTAGFQYELTERVSAGAFLYANFAANYLLDAPIGAELRYSLK